MIWLLFLLLSSFYLFESGSLQPAYVFALLAMLFSFSHQSYVRSIKIRSYHALVFAFCTYTLVVNTIWFAVYGNTGFILSSLQYYFDLAIFLFFGAALAHRSLRGKIRIGALIGLAMLIGFWLAGLGRYEAFPRYNAFFNDPNQMAFWVLCVSGMGFVLNKEFKSWTYDVALLSLTVIALSLTISRSAFLGFVPLLIAYLISVLNMQRNYIVIGFSGMIALLTAGVSLDFGSFLASDASLASDGIGLAERLSSIDMNRQLEIRGHLRFLEHPDYLLFGAGQGLHARFNPAGQEIHSTIPGVLFYYGIAGLALFLAFMLDIFRRLPNVQFMLVFLTPLLYGMTTYSLRTPINWVFLATVIAVSVQHQRREMHAYAPPA